MTLDEKEKLAQELIAKKLEEVQKALDEAGQIAEEYDTSFYWHGIEYGSGAYYNSSGNIRKIFGLDSSVKVTYEVSERLAKQDDYKEYDHKYRAGWSSSSGMC